MIPTVNDRFAFTSQCNGVGASWSSSYVPDALSLEVVFLTTITQDHLDLEYRRLLCVLSP